MCCKWGGGCKGNLHQGFSLWNLFQRCVRPSGPVERGLRAIGPLSKCVAGGGGGAVREDPPLWFLFVEHCFSVVRGVPDRFDKVFYLSVHYCTSVR
jgi:hypothetical protein